MKKKRLAIFASGSGSNAEAIMSYFQNHESIEVAAVISNRPDAFVLERAKKFKVSAKVFDKKQFRECDDLLTYLQQNQITHIVLAGFLLMISERFIAAFQNKIINIHPSLLPKFGGKGMYGIHVHEAVVFAKEIETGITIHLVNERYDDGKILAQYKCSVLPSDDAATVAARVLKLEHQYYPKVIENWVLSLLF